MENASKALIIAGAIVYTVKGLNKELNYSNRQQFEISAASTPL